jgi:RNase H-fold protein (predicted Holliday junction resolvase)
MLYYINYYYPEKIIIGIPKGLDIHTGKITESKQAKTIHQFFNLFHKFLLSKSKNCPIECVDETLASQIAIHNLESMNLSRKNIIKDILT